MLNGFREGFRGIVMDRIIVTSRACGWWLVAGDWFWCRFATFFYRAAMNEPAEKNRAARHTPTSHQSPATSHALSLAVRAQNADNFR
jgi:hypothetical protein